MVSYSRALYLYLKSEYKVILSNHKVLYPVNVISLQRKIHSVLFIFTPTRWLTSYSNYHLQSQHITVLLVHLIINDRFFFCNIIQICDSCVSGGRAMFVSSICSFSLCQSVHVQPSPLFGSSTNISVPVRANG